MLWREDTKVRNVNVAEYSGNTGEKCGGANSNLDQWETCGREYGCKENMIKESSHCQTPIPGFIFIVS